MDFCVFSLFVVLNGNRTARLIIQGRRRRSKCDTEAVYLVMTTVIARDFGNKQVEKE
jgi:hypothetical protein